MKQKTKTILMWVLILSAGAIGFFGEFEIPLGWYIAALAIAIVFIDGTYKDKISDLEFRIDDLNERLNELDGFVDEKING